MHFLSNSSSGRNISSLVTSIHRRINIRVPTCEPEGRQGENQLLLGNRKQQKCGPVLSAISSAGISVRRSLVPQRHLLSSRLPYNEATLAFQIV